jgi:hypothetical protein
MPKATANAHLTAADEAFSMVVDAREFIEASIEAYGTVTESNKEKISDKLKVVSDALPAMLALLQDIQKQWSGVNRADQAVWYTAEPDILECYYACKALQRALGGTYVRLGEGGPASDRLTNFLARKGKRAEEHLGTIHASMKRLESLKIVTEVQLLEDVGKALASVVECRD